MLRYLPFLLLLCACSGGTSGSDNQPPSTVDSQTLQLPPDGGPQIDTDDHNRPSAEGITLDSPVGPQHRDTMLPRP
ncbi:MAG: hypothetical protein EOO08_01980 [Chitinophagaceae bacterium]|nr:MAG: hypothetical protein EOO08_01980 [Chitinophagaceae bacterium]